MIWFECRILLLECSSILLQTEWIDFTETVTGFSYLFTEKKILFFTKMSTLRIEKKKFILATDRLYFCAILPVVDQKIKLVWTNLKKLKIWKRHLNIKQGRPLASSLCKSGNIKMLNGFFWQNLQKKVYNRKSEYHYWILHIQNNMGTILDKTFGDFFTF